MHEAPISIEQSRVEQQLDGAPPGLAHTGLHLEQLLRHMDVHGDIRINFLQPQRRFPQVLQGHRAQAVERHPG